MQASRSRFALCLDTTDYEASLIRGNVYPVVPDARAAKDDLIRVIDEDGEDYLFPQAQFVLVGFPRSVAKRILAVAAPA